MGGPTSCFSSLSGREIRDDEIINSSHQIYSIPLRFYFISRSDRDKIKVEITNKVARIIYQSGSITNKYVVRLILSIARSNFFDSRVSLLSYTKRVKREEKKQKVRQLNGLLPACVYTVRQDLICSGAVNIYGRVDKSVAIKRILSRCGLYRVKDGTFREFCVARE